MKNIYFLLFVFLFSHLLSAQEVRQLNNAEMNLVRNVAKEYVSSFQSGCNRLINKNFIKDRFSDIENLLIIFDRPSQRYIEISSLSSQEKYPRKIKEYLIRLNRLKYVSVKIEWTDLYFSDKLIESEEMKIKHPGEDWYEGVAVIAQKFIASTGEFKIIDDVVRTFKVYAQKVEIRRGPHTTESFVVKLGDIRVSETKTKKYRN